ncbi:hypothetical protein [Candidatus Paracaedibacter symbiosus]|uniref:hypothetical protein n=1 Tax=Candidatus Paracaedibacter symbiosus TaxID=244582 RepID=UPI0005097E99|nr:hypothetical protein [Candidatus Paracaedibacter symbiosus]
MSSENYIIPLRDIISFISPVDFPLFGEAHILNRIGVTNFDITDTLTETSVHLTLAFQDELLISLPGLEGFGIALGANGRGSEIPLEIQVRPVVVFRLKDVDIALRLGKEILIPVSRSESNEWQPRLTVDDKPAAFEIFLENISFEVREDGDVSLQFATGIPTLNLGAFMIGQTGVIVEADQPISLQIGREGTPTGYPPGWQGVHIPHARIHLPAIDFPMMPESLEFVNCSIGGDGFTGGVAAEFPTNAPHGTLGEIDFELIKCTLDIKQNSFVACNIQGKLTLPFFDVPVGIEIGISQNGGFVAALSATQPTYHNGLIKHDIDNLLSLTVESIGFAYDKGIFTVALSGEIKPHVKYLDWPAFRIQELAIDSKGNVRLEGGWLNLREQYTLAFHGFQLEISKIGFGSTDDGRRWIGLNGGLKLVEGLAAGASVEGMKILWKPGTKEVDLTLNGVGVEFKVPNALYFKGEIAMTEPEEGIYRFDGNITLNIVALDLEIQGQLVVGYDVKEDYTFLAIYLATEWPAGIPLCATGLGIYGMAGLFTLQMEPSKAENQPWYAIDDPTNSWYHKPPVGIMDLETKWKRSEGSLAFGAGITLATVFDNGYAFAGRFLLAIIFPGPIILLEGRANILKERASLNGEEPIFRSHAVFDKREGSMLVNLDAHYKYDDEGRLIEIRGATEAFFKSPNWHLYLGMDEPKERRIRAEIFKLFEANAYFMMDNRGLRTGAWIGYDNDWKFGPLKIILQAWMEGGAALSWKPIYFKGNLWLHGKVEAKIYGKGFGLGADAQIKAGVFNPFHIVGDLSIEINLPRPIKDIKLKIPLEWGPKPKKPLLPYALKEISIEHFKVRTSWPLPSDSLPSDSFLLPHFDEDNDGFFDDEPTPSKPLAEIDLPSNNLPIVPLDARPHLTFIRSINDAALIGLNPSDPEWERIGNPEERKAVLAKVKISLDGIWLHRFVGDNWEEDWRNWEEDWRNWEEDWRNWEEDWRNDNKMSWQIIARKRIEDNPDNTPKDSLNPDGVRKIFGSWAPVPQLSAGTPMSAEPGPTANTKLWLWSKSPFNYTRRTGGHWDEWFTEQYPNYPCINIPEDEVICCDFAAQQLGSYLTPPWSCAVHPEITIGWHTPPNPDIRENVDLIGEPVHMLTFSAESKAVVTLKEATKHIQIFGAVSKDKKILECFDFRKDKESTFKNPRVEQGFIFDKHNAQGASMSEGQIVTVTTPIGELSGMDIGKELRITLPTPAAFVELMISSKTRPIEVSAYNEEGKVVAKAKQLRSELAPLSLTTPSHKDIIKTIILCGLENEAFLHQVCFRRASRLIATAVDSNGNVQGVYEEQQGLIEIPGQSVHQVYLEAGNAPWYLVRICLTKGLETEERKLREDMLRHIITQTATWQAEGEVLPAWSILRLTVKTTVDVKDFSDPAFNRERSITQFAYFRTEGPPGLTLLSVPVNSPFTKDPPSSDPKVVPHFESGLEDLSNYVAQTIPATVPSQEGEKPLLPKPVYRAYDVGIQFNENYVDQMYSMVGRDLSLYLLNNNDELARDDQGRILNPPNLWGRQDTLTLTESELQWIRHINATTCIEKKPISFPTLPRNKQVTTEGHLLESDMLYEARLKPLLLHETFSSYSLETEAIGPEGTLSDGLAGGWYVQDEGTQDGPSRWVVRVRWVVGEEQPSYYIEQTSNISDGSELREQIYSRGTVLLPAYNPKLPSDHHDQPGNWTDYRLSAYLRSSDNGLMGVGVRMSDRNGYLFYIDGERNRQRLVQLTNGEGVLLAETTGSYLANFDVYVVLEALGDKLRVFVDGKLIFDVRDAAFKKGRCALYCSENAGSCFTDIRIDDLRNTIAPLYQFKFITSRFTDFCHHIHSFSGRVFAAQLPDLNDVSESIGKAISINDSIACQKPSETEARAYNTLAVKALGTAAYQPIAGVDITRIEHGNQALAFLVRTGEPLDWRRISLEVMRAAEQPLIVSPALGPRLIAASFPNNSNANPNEESVTILMDEARELKGWRIEYRTLPSPNTADQSDGDILFDSNFTDITLEASLRRTKAWEPQFNSLEEVQVISSQGQGYPSWGAEGGILSQTGNFLIPEPLTRANPVQCGTHAIAGNLAWEDIIFKTRLQSQHSALDQDVGSMGVLVRYQNESNYYRFSLDIVRGMYHLVKCVNGHIKVLFSKPFTYNFGANYDLEIKILGSRITVRLDNTLDNTRVSFAVRDTDLTYGCVGFYTWGRPLAQFSHARVDILSRHLESWVIQDIGMNRVSKWLIQDNQLIQEKALQSSGSELAGSFILNGSASWSDVRITANIGTVGAGKVGLIWRYADSRNHYRFLLDPMQNKWQLLSVKNGVVSLLRDIVSESSADAMHNITIEAVGTRIRVWREGEKLFEVFDEGSTSGLVGLMCGEGQARSSSFSVVHAAPQWGKWHEFSSSKFADGKRLQVLAGRSTDDQPVSSRPGEIRLFQETDPAAFNPHFASQGVDLQLVSDTGKVVHRRRFLSDAAYTPVSPLILRAADGTSFILTGSAEEASNLRLNNGEYRLKFTFHRKVEADPTIIKLSQQDDSSPEITQIDVPWNN